MLSSSLLRFTPPFLLLAGILAAVTPQALPAQQRVGRGLSPSRQKTETQIALGYAVDAFLPARGGLGGDPVALDNLDLLLHLDLGALLGLRGTTIRVHGQSNRGKSVDAEIGNLQGISNLEAPEEWRLYEAWVEHRTASSRLSILGGVYDVNSEFDLIPSAGDFLNSSFGFGPDYSLSGRIGPSTYPNTSLAARIKVQLLSSFYGLLGASDGAPGSLDVDWLTLDGDQGALISLEAGYARLQDIVTTASGLPIERDRRGQASRVDRPSARRQRRRIGRGQLIERVSTKVAVGGWAYTRRSQSWAPDRSPARSWGVYVLGERLLYTTQDRAGSLSGFARVGTAANAVNRLDLFLGGGLVYRSPLPGRPDDMAALGVAHARNGSPFLEARREAGTSLERSETVLELTYRAQVGRFLVLQPDIQWVMNPGMDPGLADALVFGLRSHLLLELPGGSRNP